MGFSERQISVCRFQCDTPVGERRLKCKKVPADEPGPSLSSRLCLNVTHSEPKCTEEEGVLFLLHYQKTC